MTTAILNRIPPNRFLRLKLSHWHAPRSCRRSYAVTTSTTSSPEIYDVVCVGGGPAGLSLLAGLRASPATADLKIALIDSQDLQKNTLDRRASLAEFSNRCSSLTPASVSFLKDVGAWPHVDASRVQPYQEMQVWDGVTDARISFDWTGGLQSANIFTPPSSPHPTIAHMIENKNLTTALLTHLSSTSANIDTLSPAKITSISLGSDTPDLDLRSWPILTLDNGRSLAARLLVGADGANSGVRSFARIPSRGWDYERHGVVATIRHDETQWPHDDSHRIAYQRFLPTGPVALLPLPGPFATLVWTTLPSHASYLKSLSPSAFIAMVNAAFRLSPTDIAYMHTLASDASSSPSHEAEYTWRSTHTPHESPPRIPFPVTSVQPHSIASFPLRLRHADTYASSRIALVGDAAHTVHPLAGQGLNLGQSDAAALSGVIARAAGQGADIGSPLVLEKYVSARWAANNAMLGVCDKLHKVYSAGSGPVVWGRSLGLRAVDSVGLVKEFFMRRAAGI